MKRRMRRKEERKWRIDYVKTSYKGRKKSRMRGLEKEDEGLRKPRRGKKEKWRIDYVTKSYKGKKGRKGGLKGVP